MYFTNRQNMSAICVRQRQCIKYLWHQPKNVFTSKAADVISVSRRNHLNVRINNGFPQWRNKTSNSWLASYQTTPVNQIWHKYYLKFYVLKPLKISFPGTKSILSSDDANNGSVWNYLCSAFRGNKSELWKLKVHDHRTLNMTKTKTVLNIRKVLTLIKVGTLIISFSKEANDVRGWKI